MIEPRHLDAEQLSSLIDGRLEAAERGGAEAHLAGCDRCRAARESLSATVALLRRLPAVEPPRSFLLPPTIQAPIELAERRPLLERLAPWTRAAGALAAALFVALVTVDIIGGMGAQAPTANRELAAAPARPAEPAKPAEAAKPAPTSAPAARPAAPAAAPAAAPQPQDRAADSAKPAGAAAPQPTQAAPAPAAAAASPAAAAAKVAAARPAASPAAAPARAAEPTVAESAAAGPTPIPPGFVATVPIPPPTTTLQPTPRPTPPPSGPALVKESSSLRPWQVVSGLLAVTLLLASFLLPRLNRWLRAQ
jgi:hypothetical protein